MSEPIGTAATAATPQQRSNLNNNMKLPFSPPPPPRIPRLPTIASGSLTTPPPHHRHRGTISTPPAPQRHRTTTSTPLSRIPRLSPPPPTSFSSSSAGLGATTPPITSSTPSSSGQLIDARGYRVQSPAVTPPTAPRRRRDRFAAATNLETRLAAAAADRSPAVSRDRQRRSLNNTQLQVSAVATSRDTASAANLETRIAAAAGRRPANTRAQQRRNLNTQLVSLTQNSPPPSPPLPAVVATPLSRQDTIRRAATDQISITQLLASTAAATPLPLEPPDDMLCSKLDVIERLLDMKRRTPQVQRNEERKKSAMRTLMSMR